MARNKIQRMISWAGSRGLFNFMPDKQYLKLMFWVRMGYPLNLDNPKTLNEKVQWLKLNDRKEKYVSIVDKYSVRDIVSKQLGTQYVIPLVGGPWSSFDEIDFSLLPNSFVLKCTHDSGGVVVCKDKNTFDMEKAKKTINASLKRNYYKYSREWPYNEISPQIIAEKYIEDDTDGELKDYKILCFNGKPENIMVCTGRFSGGVKYYFFDKEWNFLRLNHGDNELPNDFSIKRPQFLHEMLDIAEKLSTGFDLARIDLCEAQGQVWFGEITLYPDSGFDTDILEETDKCFGSKLCLTKKEGERHER